MTVDLSTVPLVALSIESKQVISSLLNPPKVIPSENGLPRDWRGLAHLCKLGGEIMPLLISHPDPATYILTAWEQKEKSTTLKDFQTLLEEIDRWDILDDTLELFERDGERYLEQLQKSQISAEVITNNIDTKVLTVGKLRQGLENQYYDAFLLYADEDVNFANEMVDKLENEYNLKLCLKDRDLIGGVTFEHEAVMTLISERCDRLIVIVSPNFLKSSANKFFLNYAQALGIDKRQRKVIPCLYEKCQLPPQLEYMVILDYNRVGLYNFWKKLRDSVETTNKINESANISPVKENHHNTSDTYNKSEKDKENTKDVESLEIQKLQLQDSKEAFNMKENLNHSEFDSIHHSKDNHKKHNFLQWTKRKLSKKGEDNKKEYTPITGTVSLPSIENLDSLSTSTDLMEKKPKTKFINKYVKKVQLKKILVKS
ncbi:Myeloid differentiation primary response protein MyD88 [Eufriesea mexicana]|uniref:Myeloid differentiation primary response protein MyD88 n=1 Tax=Eufriesea mexicana TaxID=516756 RepID=A0A310S796_9HYME|nr:Myeloid differentiation primary response protein MyD88 [Eufriesea mexicana]